MKKILLICILCGMMLVGCSEKSSSDNSKATSTETTVTTLESTESTTVTTTKEKTDTTTAVTTVATTIPDETTISAKEEVETEVEVINAEKPQEHIEPTPSEPEKPAETAPPVVVPTPPPPAIATTAAPASTKQLDANFKAELVACAKEYCSTIGYTYSENYSDWGCTPSPDNTSWDIPIRTVSATANEKIKEYVVNSISFLKRSGYDDLVVCLYFENDSQASGEWRIYVLF